LHPLRWIGALALVMVGVLCLALAGSKVEGPSDEVAAAAALVAALGWAFAARAVVGCRGLDAAQRKWSGAAFAAFAVAACERSAALLSDARTFSAWSAFSAKTIVLAGWIFALLAMARSVARARKLAAARQHSMRVAHDAAARELLLRQRRDAERRHDLRSLVAGIQGATSTLANYRGLLDAADQYRLETALLSEIHRLRDTIDPLRSMPDRFHLARVLAPVLTLERSHGAVIEETIDEVAVLGDPRATVALVQNLLVNARRHAPGSLVTITTAIDDDLVRLRVSDDGPGLPTDVEKRIRSVLEGERQVVPAQPDATGHGLGLAICAHLARDQGAKLRLIDAGNGTCFELALPAAEHIAALFDARANS
jgi:signal transduction histidine kinase